MATAEPQLDEMSPERPDNVSEDRWNVLLGAWEVFDVNGDGCIEAIELIVVLQALGANPTAEDIVTIMTTFELEDKDGQKVIPKKKFFELMCNEEVANMVFECDHEAELRQAFKVLDKNGDGFITAKELRQVLGDEISSNEEAEELIRMGDTNGDGKVDYNEYVAMMCSKVNLAKKH